MKKVGKIMEELGFNKNAPESVKKAFLKNLLKQSEGINLKIELEPAPTNKGEQLSFNLDFQSTSAPTRQKAG